MGLMFPGVEYLQEKVEASVFNGMYIAIKLQITSIFALIKYCA